MILSIKNISVNFGSFYAVNGFSLDFPDKGLYFVIGPNGAGKTTLLDAICGRVKVGKGTIQYKQSQNIQNKSPESIFKLGISRKFQNPTIFPQHTVYENIKLAQIEGKSFLWYYKNAKVEKEDDESIMKILDKMALSDFQNERASELSHGQKQWLEIGMAIIKKPDLLLVDEPIAGMTYDERIKTGNIFKELSKNTSIIAIEHDVDFVKSFADYVTVMHEGRVMCSGSFDEIKNNEEVVNVYLGHR